MEVDARSGFTLIELIVVLLILAIVAGATAPALLGDRAPDDDLTAAVRRVEALFRLARDSAIASGAPVTVVVDSATSFVWLLAENAPDSAASDSTNRPIAGPRGESASTGLADGIPLDLPAPVSLLLGTTRARFTFLPTGAAMADSLVLRHAATDLVITVDSWTGDVLKR